MCVSDPLFSENLTDGVYAERAAWRKCQVQHLQGRAAAEWLQFELELFCEIPSSCKEVSLPIQTITWLDEAQLREEGCTVCLSLY